MIRVTYVMSCHDSRYTQHFDHTTMETVKSEVRMKMSRAYFDMDLPDGFVRIYTNKVSAIEVRDLSREEAILKAQQEGA